MTIAAYAATCLAVAGIHAFVLRKGAGATLNPALTHFHRAALAVSLSIGIPAAIVQPISGDLSARFVARWQPVKLAAMEGQFETERGAPLRIEGWPDLDREVTRHAIEIPRGLSLLAYHDPEATVQGLKDFARTDRPPVRVVHVILNDGRGVRPWRWSECALAWLLCVVGAPVEPTDRLLLAALVIVAPFGFCGDRSWLVHDGGGLPAVGHLRRASNSRCRHAHAGLVVPFTIVTLLYCALGAVVVWLLWRQIVRTSGSVAPVQGRSDSHVA